MKRLAVVLALAASLVAAKAARAEDAPEALFSQGAGAIAKGAWNEAIDAFEALADRGFVHPDASFDRALAYVGRVRAKAERPGDLGRAAAALEETLALRPGDRDAEAALELVRAEVARRHARSGSVAEIDARPTFERAVVGLAGETTWAWLAAFASALLTAGLLLRRAADESALHVAGTIATPLGALALAATLALTWGAGYLRRTTEAAVVVAADVRLTDDAGRPLAGAIVPEAARVEIVEHRGSRVRLRWGGTTGFAAAADARILPTP